MTATTAARLELESVRPSELAGLVEGTGRAATVWRALRLGEDPIETDALSERARELLEQHTRRAVVDVEKRVSASCGTAKLTARLADGERVELVLIPGSGRTTVCVSTQAGCGRGCIFCATATMGLSRGLTSGEIVGQVVRATAEAHLRDLPPVRNVVFMGMGEPLDNLDAVRASVEILCDPLALGIGGSHVTLSTVAPSPAAVLATKGLDVQLAWSLHAADDARRRRLVPTARHSTAALREAFLERLGPDGTLFVEVTLMDGVNDAPIHADELAELLRPFGSRARVNLLPMNPGRAALRPSSRARAIAFRQRVRERGYFCAIREPRGLDVAAACGQLAISTPPRRAR